MDLQDFYSKFKPIIELGFPFLYATLIFIIGWWLAGRISKLIKTFLEKTHLEKGLISFTQSILEVLLRIIVILAALAKIGVNISSIIAALGAVFVTIGLALKEAISNIASGILIVINKPFGVGDFIEIENFSGTVIKIELMYTTLINSQYEQVIIPNTKLVTVSFKNTTAQKIRKIKFSFQIDDINIYEKMQVFFVEYFKNNEKILRSPHSEIYFGEYVNEKINLNMSVWCNINDVASLEKEINEILYRNFSIKKHDNMI